jgi:hypothetical protein
MHVANVVKFLAAFASRKWDFAERRVVPIFTSALGANSFGVFESEARDKGTFAARLTLVVERTVECQYDHGKIGVV